MKLPSKYVLKKYGLTLQEWLTLYQRHNGACHGCLKPFKDGQRVNVDHEHVRGWKKMKPEQRKKYVRGLLCYVCNRFINMRGVDTERLYNAWQYRRRYEVRITSEELVKLEKSGKLDIGKKRVKSRDISDPDQQ